ncbi:MAG: TerB family tellurite resistance protein [Bacteroidales bacterium]|nr:TerB family tellurite resistance protein [Bacteroidales bacterium]
MAKFTRYLFAGLGWAIAGPIGALLGYVLGKSIAPDKNPTDTPDAPPLHTPHSPYRDSGSQADFNAALMVLIAAVMKADGVVKRSELTLVKQFLLTNYGEQRGKEMLGILRQMVDADIPLDQVCQQIKVNTAYDTRYHMLDFLFAIAAADAELHPAEINTLHRIASRLGIATTDYLSMHARHAAATGSQSQRSQSHQQGSNRSSTAAYNKDPYRVLGIDSSATDDEVRRAYRRMAMKYHPDRVAGMSEEIQRNAAQQMQEINQAYEVIKSRRQSLK